MRKSLKGLTHRFVAHARRYSFVYVFFCSIFALGCLSFVIGGAAALRALETAPENALYSFRSAFRSDFFWLAILFIFVLDFLFRMAGPSNTHSDQKLAFRTTFVGIGLLDSLNRIAVICLLLPMILFRAPVASNLSDVERLLRAAGEPLMMVTLFVSLVLFASVLAYGYVPFAGKKLPNAHELRVVLFSPVGSYLVRKKRFRYFADEWYATATLGAVLQNRFFFRLLGWLGNALLFWRWPLVVQRIVILLLMLCVSTALLAFFTLDGLERYRLDLWGASKVMQPEKEFGRFILTFIVGAPVAFAIWLFRDHNARMTVENTRKDTNLKDFQRLTEQAAGLQLIEDKSVDTTKIDARNGVSEKVISVERSVAGMSKMAGDTSSRREGAVAMQAAAIYQLGRFGEGVFGSSFVPPAFFVIRDLWRVQTLSLATDFNKIAAAIENGELLAGTASDSAEDLNARYNTALDELSKLNDFLVERLSAPALQALQAAIASLPEMRFKSTSLGNWLVCDDFAQSTLIGLAAGRGSRFTSAKKIQCFSKSVLHGANFYRLQLALANFSETQAVGARFSKASMPAAGFTDAKLFGCYFNDTDLSAAVFKAANLQLCTFTDAVLYGSDFSGANLNGTHFRNPKIDKRTNFTGALTGLHTRVFVGVPKDAAARRVWAFPNDFEVDSEATLALRKKLRDENGLILPEQRYEAI
ncbi:MAG: pentapeptide repeat-containing protein [Burkholderiales bacterium]|nr:pentapeptide repeat-containing protein [Burkholderiales bacterium]